MKVALTIIFLAAAVGLIFWAARPIWNDVLGLRAEIGVIEDTLARLHELEGLRDELLNAYNSIPRSKVERLYDLLPQKPDSGNILVALERIARDRGVRLRRVDFIKDSQAAAPQTAGPARIAVKEEAAANTISYSFTLSASYESFRSFLAALEKNLRVADVTDISFTGGSSNLFEFTLKAKSYYQR
ncbi:hypothetical protein A3B19_03140 [Candidatus Giovannonibacteria bacterium RIFCSPLOWO2_01_FULL_46_32]|uniref:Pilus assembly protein PilO n=1 Tax=Candidatus Giovannonibacteria bacterium RIFCSPLOWO2_01_FULL_46_32 TaxID=1798353 RepID=A0A1F5XGZ3_9BACT|nr:MAG: hypothetical protein A3B19_03140 [Candidatus Giovannonibacteria bacterium RIFCSPLOWO2_01_FULL_46_32]